MNKHKLVSSDMQRSKFHRSTPRSHEYASNTLPVSDMIMTVG